MKPDKTIQNDAAIELALGDQILEGRIVEALERRPAIVVPANFSARLMSRLPERQAVVPTVSISRRIAYVSVAVVTLALLLLAGLNPSAMETGKSFVFGVEMLLVAELLSVGLWLGLRREG